MVYLLNVRIEGRSVASLDPVALVPVLLLPEGEVFLAVEEADLAEVVGVALAGEHGVVGQVGGGVFLKGEN